MKKLTPLKQRMITYLNREGISKHDCYKDTGISNGVFSQSNGLSEDNILKFVQSYKKVSLPWLFLGEGTMLDQDNSLQVCLEKLAILEQTVQELSRDKTLLQDTVKNLNQNNEMLHRMLRVQSKASHAVLSDDITSESSPNIS